MFNGDSLRSSGKDHKEEKKVALTRKNCDSRTMHSSPGTNGFWICSPL